MLIVHYHFTFLTTDATPLKLLVHAKEQKVDKCNEAYLEDAPRILFSSKQLMHKHIRPLDGLRPLLCKHRKDVSCSARQQSSFIQCITKQPTSSFVCKHACTHEKSASLRPDSHHCHYSHIQQMSSRSSN